MSTIHDLWVAGQDFQRGRDITSDGESGTGLLEALLREDRDTVQSLLVAGVGIGLREAALLGDAVRVRNLLDEGADPRCQSGWSALHLAAWGGHPQAIEALLHSGLPVDLRSKATTPLHLAVSRRHRAAAAVLLRHGADPNRADGAGWSPLHTAADRGDMALAKLLVEAGADPSQRVGDCSSVDLARRGRHRELAALLGCLVDA